MILIIDNYDSFTYNIAQYSGKICNKIDIVKNDLIDLNQIKKKNYSHIIISPGPGAPKEAGNCIPIIQNFYKKIPILGICLGHQAIGEAFGANIKKNKSIVHGKISNIYNDQQSVLYNGIPKFFKATRYHSLIIDKNTLKIPIRVNSWLKDYTIMGIEHSKYPLYGVQYHPESIKTEFGEKLIKNFLMG